MLTLIGIGFLIAIAINEGLISSILTFIGSLLFMTYVLKPIT